VSGRALVAAAGMLALGTSCGPASRADAGSFTGVDEALIRGCVACHRTTGLAWAQSSSHHLLFDCSACHQARGAPGSHHMDSLSCGDCHSQAQHHSVSCGACHDVHGTENLALVRPELGRFRVWQGDAPDGLAHRGAGVCEGCHTATGVYRADGGAAHDTGWCITCHPHAEGFRAAP
jgi:hypothetical protein